MQITYTASAQKNIVYRTVALFCNVTTQKGMFALADQAVSSAGNFLTGVIIGRACTKEEFGLYMLGFSVMFFVTNLQASLISTPYMIYSPHLKGDARARYTGSTLIHQWALSGLVMFILVVGSVILSLGIGPLGLASVMWALVAVIAFIMLRDYVRKICFAGLQMKTVLILDSCVAFLQISGLLLLSYLGYLSAGLAYWVIGIACGITAMGWLILNRKSFTPRVRHAISDLGRNWSLGKWIFIGALVWALSINLYPWILASFHGTAATGVWAACHGIIAITRPQIVGMQNLLGPKIIHSYAEGGAIALYRFVLKAIAVFLFLITPFCVALFLFGGWLVAIIYGHRYTGNGLLISILAVNLLVSVPSFSFSRALLAIERADVDSAANFVALFVLLTIGLWLVKSFGPIGVAYGLLIGTAVTSVVKCFAFIILIRSIAERKTRSH